MEILDKKSNRMSRANAGVFEHSEFPDLQRILDFLSLRNLLSNELFFTFYYFAIALLCYYKIWSKINMSLIFSSCANSNTLDIISAVLGSSSINGKKILPLC